MWVSIHGAPAASVPCDSVLGSGFPVWAVGSELFVLLMVWILVLPPFQANKLASSGFMSGIKAPGSETDSRHGTGGTTLCMFVPTAL